jgi:hypothetical protein
MLSYELRLGKESGQLLFCIGKRCHSWVRHSLARRQQLLVRSWSLPRLWTWSLSWWESRWLQQLYPYRRTPGSSAYAPRGNNRAPMPSVPQSWPPCQRVLVPLQQRIHPPQPHGGHGVFLNRQRPELVSDATDYITSEFEKLTLYDRYSVR